MIEGQFHLPVWYDLLATFAFGISGAVLALRKGYDIVGVTSLALAVGVGGGAIRDGIFLQTTPAFATDWRYLAVLLIAVATAVLLQKGIEHRNFVRIVAFMDALGLAAYAVVGTQKSLFAGLAVISAVLVGTINAVGGGVLGDVLSGENPRVFKPSQLYALVAASGALLFWILCRYFHLSAQVAAVIAMTGMVCVRVVVIRFDVKTVPAHDLTKPLERIGVANKARGQSQN